MKVKITKSIDIDSVPREIRSMVDSAKRDLEGGLPQSFSHVVKDCLSNSAEEFFETLQKLSAFREDLKKFDESLQEVYNILEGYKKYLTEPVAEPTILEEEPPEQESYSAEELEERASSKREDEEDIKNRINNAVQNTSKYLKSHGYEVGEQTQEQLDRDQAQYEKLMSQTGGADEVEDEEG